MSTIFQERLLSCRKKRKKTQIQAANEMGINSRSYQRYENGEADPSLISLIKIADYFEVSADYLLGRTDKEKYE